MIHCLRRTHVTYKVHQTTSQTLIHNSGHCQATSWHTTLTSHSHIFELSTCWFTQTEFTKTPRRHSDSQFMTTFRMYKTLRFYHLYAVKHNFRQSSSHWEKHCKSHRLHTVKNINHSIVFGTLKGLYIDERTWRGEKRQKKRNRSNRSRLLRQLMVAEVLFFPGGNDAVVLYSAVTPC